MLDDGNIGNASSSATTRANADTATLFAVFWDNISDTYAAVSGGRGASAAADYAANKTIDLPKAKGRALIGSGTGSGLTARALGETGGTEDAINVSHTHADTFATASTGAHTHNTQYYNSGIGGTTIGTASKNATLSSLQATTSAGAHTHTVTGSVTTAGSSGTDVNSGPWSAINYMVKL
jgi:microcystin-dependent protein